ncbi:MAG: TIGR04086 family membrane protein [Clostridia bacterium]|nr:TIGR04086 family membrane protein [Clostridia bacterium]
MEQTSSAPMRTLKGALLGLCAALLCAVLLTFLFSALLALGVPDGSIPFFAILTVFLAAVGGGLAAGIKGKNNGLLLGLCTGIALGLTHLLATVVFGGFTLFFLAYFAAETLGGMLGGILGVNLRRS